MFNAFTQVSYQPITCCAIKVVCNWLPAKEKIHEDQINATLVMLHLVGHLMGRGSQVYVIGPIDEPSGHALSSEQTCTMMNLECRTHFCCFLGSCVLSRV